MTKAELLADLASIYTVVGTPYSVQSSDSHLPTSVTCYSVSAYETGSSEVNKKPVIRQKNINFCVYNEGLGGEAAYYVGDESVNEVNADITGNNSLLAINKIFTSEEIRKRVQSAVAKAAQDVFNEAIPSSLLTSDTTAGKKRAVVASGSLFWEGKTVRISDSTNYEDLTISRISTNALIFDTTMVNAYTVAGGGAVAYKNDFERLNWAVKAMIDPNVYTMAMTNFVALNPTIQASGGLATDNDIQYVVNSNITKLAVALYNK
jgi:hypothetical protein